jgi:hypothetical protein
VSVSLPLKHHLALPVKHPLGTQVSAAERDPRICLRQLGDQEPRWGWVAGYFFEKGGVYPDCSFIPRDHEPIWARYPYR